MKIRNIITTSALVVLLGLTGGSAFAADAGDAGDNDILVLHATANEVASTSFAGVSVQVGDAGDNDILVLGSTVYSEINEVEVASTDSNEIPYSDK